MKEDMNRLRLIKRYEPIAINTVDEGRYDPIKIDRDMNRLPLIR